jgi:(p)ppGpp synthase/HD superfamily hydrolase
MQDRYHEPCQYSTRLLEKLESLDTKKVLDFNLINKAIYWARKYHGEQKRMSGEPYYSHPLEVAYMVSDYNLKTDVIVASILHDIVEDTEVTAGMILDHFSWRIAQMVDRLTRDRPDGSKLSIEQILTSAYYLKDQEVLLIKLMDRIHNLSTLNFISIEKQKLQINESIKNFLIFAEELSLPDIGEYIYKECVNLNVKLKVVSLSDLKYREPVFDKEFSLLVLANQNVE